MGDVLATKIMTQGLRLYFSEKPVLRLVPPTSYHISEKTILALEEDFLPKWEERKIVREILSPMPLHFSIMFMRPKKNGKLRPIIDLKALNDMLILEKFKMETVEVISQTVQGILWGCSIDIEDAYFHVPINWEFHKYLAFKIRNRTFVFQFLPFGLSPAPWAFTRVIRPVKARLHSLLIMIFIPIGKVLRIRLILSYC